MGKPSRDKGKRGEREAAAELNKLFDCEAHRAQQYCGADHDADIKCNIDGLHFEVKRQERMQLYKWMEQAENDKRYSEIPVVLTRQNNKPWLLAIQLDDLPNLIDAINEYRSSS